MLKRRILRYVVVFVLLTLFVIGLLLPVVPQTPFLIMAILILALEHRWLRDALLKRIRRWFPRFYLAASRGRRAILLRLRARLGGAAVRQSRAERPFDHGGPAPDEATAPRDPREHAAVSKPPSQHNSHLGGTIG